MNYLLGKIIPFVVADFEFWFWFQLILRGIVADFVALFA